MTVVQTIGFAFSVWISHKTIGAYNVVNLMFSYYRLRFTLSVKHLPRATRLCDVNCLQKVTVNQNGVCDDVERGRRTDCDDTSGENLRRLVTEKRLRRTSERTDGRAKTRTATAANANHRRSVGAATNGVHSGTDPGLGASRPGSRVGAVK